RRPNVFIVWPPVSLGIAAGGGPRVAAPPPSCSAALRSTASTSRTRHRIVEFFFSPEAEV
ncbi:MAG: hypothetical protein AAF368_08225, partial [Planctomycetota bacterium]